MGTNFYFEPDRGGAHFHIGKRSAGWKFTVHKWDEYRIDSWQTLAHFLEATPGVVYDEYGQAYTPVSFYVQEHNRSHQQLRPNARDMDEDWARERDVAFDEEGHTVWAGDFC